MLLSHWLTIAAICVLGAMSPGPSLAVVLKHTLQGSRFHGMAAGIGHGLGVWIYALISVMGLSFIIQSVPLVFQALQLLGAGFLFWLGIQSFRADQSRLPNAPANLEATTSKAFLSGFLIAFFNPKIAVFFVALFSQFVDPESTFSVKLLYATTAGVIDLGWYCLVALIFGHQTVNGYMKRWMHRVEQLLGLLLMALGIRLALMIL